MSSTGSGRLSKGVSGVEEEKRPIVIVSETQRERSEEVTKRSKGEGRERAREGREGCELHRGRLAGGYTTPVLFD